MINVDIDDNEPGSFDTAHHSPIWTSSSLFTPILWVSLKMTIYMVIMMNMVMLTTMLMAGWWWFATPILWVFPENDDDNGFEFLNQMFADIRLCKLLTLIGDNDDSSSEDDDEWWRCRWRWWWWCWTFWHWLVQGSPWEFWASTPSSICAINMASTDSNNWNLVFGNLSIMDICFWNEIIIFCSSGLCCLMCCFSGCSVCCSVCC